MDITIGDPAGIGPEVILRALGELPTAQQAQWTLHADPWMLAQWAERLRLPLPAVRYRPLAIPPERALTAQTAARIAWASLESARAALAAGTAKGVVTAPISKERLQAIGFSYPGHTEFFADTSGTPDVRMMLVGESLKVVLESIHLPLHDVPKALSAAHFRQTLLLAKAVLRRHFAIADPTIAVCGLNPHAGENGYLGREEIEILKPVIAEFDGVFGPLASDAYFGTRAYERYDLTVCMYHDQGLIPFKLLHFDSGVNLTIGLPYIRTSPDHGCAFDIAGQGVASARSFLEAMHLLTRLSAAR